MICIFLKERMRNAKNFNARKVLEVAFQNAKEKTLKPSIFQSGTWSHRMPVWAILINRPLNRTRYIKTWGTLNPGFSVYHTVSEAERKTVQCMDSDGSSIKNQDCRDTSKVGTWNGWTIEGKCWCDLTHWISVRVRSSALGIPKEELHSNISSTGSLRLCVLSQ